MIQVVDPTQKQAFDDQRKHADDRRRQKKSGPVSDPKILQKQPCRHCAEHVLSAMGEIDNP